jgi:hypothetical protein
MGPGACVGFQYTHYSSITGAQLIAPARVQPLVMSGTRPDKQVRRVEEPDAFGLRVRKRVPAVRPRQSAATVQQQTVARRSAAAVQHLLLRKQ